MMILIVITLNICFLPLYGDEDGWKSNGFLGGLSLGWVFPTYNEPMDTTFNEIVDLGGFYRINAGFNVELGYNFYRDMYFVAGFEGIEDVIEDSILLNSSFYYFGIRNYPFHNGLLFEVKGGPCSLYYDSSLEDSETSDNGFGFGLTFGYDFGKTTEGFSYETGLNLSYLTDMRFNDSDPVSARQTMIYGKILWK